MFKPSKYYKRPFTRHREKRPKPAPKPATEPELKFTREQDLLLAGLAGGLSAHVPLDPIAQAAEDLKNQ
jgi:hypothetical protein